MGWAGSLWDTMANTWDMARGRYKYSPLPARNPVKEAQDSLTFWARNNQRVLKVTMAIMAAAVLWYLVAATV